MCFLLVSWEYRLYFLFLFFKQTTTMDKHNHHNVSNIYTSDKVPLRRLAETGAVVFSNLVLVLLPPLSTKVGRSGQHHTKPLYEKESVSRETALCCFLMLVSGPPSSRPLPQTLIEAMEKQVV